MRTNKNTIYLVAGSVLVFLWGGLIGLLLAWLVLLVIACTLRVTHSMRNSNSHTPDSSTTHQQDIPRHHDKAA